MDRYGAACEDCSWTYECSDVSVAREAVARHARLHDDHEPFYLTIPNTKEDK